MQPGRKGSAGVMRIHIVEVGEVGGEAKKEHVEEAMAGGEIQAKEKDGQHRSGEQGGTRDEATDAAEPTGSEENGGRPEEGTEETERIKEGVQVYQEGQDKERRGQDRKECWNTSYSLHPRTPRCS